MDPIRQFYRRNFSLTFHAQTDPNEHAIPGAFTWKGISLEGNDMAFLSNQMAMQNAFAVAWTQKLCGWANSAACAADDPEVLQPLATPGAEVSAETIEPESE